MRNGVWATLNLDLFARVAARFGHDAGLPAASDYLLASPLGPAVARLAGQTAPYEYARLHLVVAVVGLGLVVALAVRRCGADAGRNVAVALAVAPVTTSTFDWLGQPDAFSLPLALALTLVRSPAATLALAVPLGAAHPEQGLVVALTATLARLALDHGIPPAADRGATARAAGTQLATMVAGVVAGRLLTEVLLRISGQVITHPRTSFVELGLRGFLEHHARGGGWVVYALWGPLWLVIAGLAVLGYRDATGRRGGRPIATAEEVRGSRPRGGWSVLAAGSVVALVPAFLTLDETRVHGVVTAPLLAAGAVLAARTPRAGVLRPAAAALLVLGLVTPAVFTAGTACHASDLPTGEMIRFLRDGDGRADRDLFGWLYGPCRFVIPTSD